MDQRARKLDIVRAEHTLVVGVDIAKHKHWARVMDGLNGMQVGNAFSFENTREGFERLLGIVIRAQKATGATKVVVAMEPTGHYWKPLAWYLKKAGITVVLVNPYHVKRYKEFDDNSPSKNDRKDAWVIARLANEASFFEVYLPEGVYAELRGLTQARQQQRNKCNMALNQIRCLLDEYFPEYEDVFTDILGKASLYVLGHRPFPGDILAVSAEELAEELKLASNRRVGLKRALRLQEAARDSVGVTEGLSGEAEAQAVVGRGKILEGKVSRDRIRDGRCPAEDGVSEVPVERAWYRGCAGGEFPGGDWGSGAIPGFAADTEVSGVKRRRRQFWAEERQD